MLSGTYNYAKRYAAGRDITNQSGRVEDNMSIIRPCLVRKLKREASNEQAGVDRILSRVSPFSF